MLKGIDKRIGELEQRIAPPEKYLTYGEDPRASGMFRRGGDTSGRLMTKEEVRADAAAAGASIIFVEYFVEYESRDMSPEAGIMAGPDLEFGEGITAVFLPNNHRGDTE